MKIKAQTPFKIDANGQASFFVDGEWQPPIDLPEFMKYREFLRFQEWEYDTDTGKLRTYQGEGQWTAPFDPPGSIGPSGVAAYFEITPGPAGGLFWSDLVVGTHSFATGGAIIESTRVVVPNGVYRVTIKTQVNGDGPAFIGVGDELSSNPTGATELLGGPVKSAVGFYVEDTMVEVTTGQLRFYVLNNTFLGYTRGMINKVA